MTSITSVAEAFFAACETGKGWEGLQRLLHAQRHISRPGGAAARSKDSLLDYTRLDEGHHDGPARRSLRGEVVRDGRSAEQRCRLRSVPWHAHWPRRPGSADRTSHQHRLCLCHAVRWGQDRPHDQDMACRPGDEGTRLVLTDGSTDQSGSLFTIEAKVSVRSSPVNALPPVMVQRGTPSGAALRAPFQFRMRVIGDVGNSSAEEIRNRCPSAPRRTVAARSTGQERGAS